MYRTACKTYTLRETHLHANEDRTQKIYFYRNTDSFFFLNLPHPCTPWHDPPTTLQSYMHTVRNTE